MRLAFAVAAHLEPEILLVDEVLAVGDINFQKKCLGKMGDVARQGRTVVLVSHNMAAVNALCSRCVIMQNGRITFDGSATEATPRYYAESVSRATDGSDLLSMPRDGNGKAKFSKIVIKPLDSTGEGCEAAYSGSDLDIEIEVRCERDFSGCNLAVVFYDATGYRVMDTNTAQKGEFVSMRAGQTARAHFLLREVLLRPGHYFVRLWLGRVAMEVVDDIEYAAKIDFIESSDSSQHPLTYPGVYLCRFEQNVCVFQ
jgi:lipopolysaccharide transport system ATP-binding protein